MKNGVLQTGALKVALLYVGAVIGAGFASGQEILQFFGVYGAKGIWGVALATVLFAYLGAVIQSTAVHLRASSYREVLNYLLGRRLGRIMDLVSIGMLVAGLGIMLAGSGAVFQEQFGLPAGAGVLVLAAFVCVVIYSGLNGLLAVNAVLVPLKIILVVVVCLLALLVGGGGSEVIEEAVTERTVVGSWLVSAFLYVSYNMVVPVAVLSSLGCHLNRQQAIRGAVAGGLALGVAASIVTLAVVTFFSDLALYEVPMLFLAGIVHPAVRTIISVVIWMAVFTTAIANAHGLASRWALPGTTRYRVVGVSATLLVVPLAFIDFSFLIGFFYPLFGYAGLILILALLVRPLSRFFVAGRENHV
ncbi:MAG: hypothetical protein KJ650_10960 [Firmicutes bacterium]|nr:hypothetical protein [Bacillota bacterium]MBV1727569.1 hypothetical protein [Desulforudis sp.]MBU4534127.1 hypothetical protein [Bacillota bacterium]MBU4553373.1 hypothetical protein [Bacillota bacterium]MBV1734322.1 hypothetical protein [Desulforudis sp.]